MKTTKQVMTALGLVLCLGLATGITACAADWGDQFTITLTPSGDRGVIIDTTAIAMSSLGLGTTNFTAGAQGVVVTSTGSIGPLEYTIQGGISGGWSLSTDGLADAPDELAVHALFNATVPNIAAFEGADILKHLLGSVADVGDGAGKYEGGQEMDSLALNQNRNLWFMLKLPTTSTTPDQQTVTVTVTAEAVD